MMADTSMRIERLAEVFSRACTDEYAEATDEDLRRMADRILEEATMLVAEANRM